MRDPPFFVNFEERLQVGIGSGSSEVPALSELFLAIFLIKLAQIHVILVAKHK